MTRIDGVLVIANKFDRWIIADGVDSTAEYIIHLAKPRFMAKIYIDDIDDDDVVVSTPPIGSGINVYIEDRMFYDILWYDDPPTELEMMTIFEKADDACDRYEKFLDKQN